MGKETKIGLSIIFLLLASLGGVIAYKMQSDEGNKDLAGAEPQNEPAATATDKPAAAATKVKPTIVGASGGSSTFSVTASSGNDYWNKPATTTPSGTPANYSTPTAFASDSSSDKEPKANYMPPASSFPAYTPPNSLRTPESAKDVSSTVSDAKDGNDPFKAMNASTTTNGTSGLNLVTPTSGEGPALGGLQTPPSEVKLAPSPSAPNLGTPTPPQPYPSFSPSEDSRMRELYAPKTSPTPAATEAPKAAAPATAAPPAMSMPAWSANPPATNAAPATPTTNFGTNSLRNEPPLEPKAMPRTLPSNFEPTPVRTTSATSVPVHSGETYTVAPNDNYYLISEKVYGNGSYFKALEEHNRERFPHPERLKVGDTISTPSLDTLQQKYASLCPKVRGPAPAEPSAVRPVSATNGGRMYTVQEGDTLFNIARYQLGRASRWAEIYDMNRSVLGSDFDYLAPGTQLMLPDNGASTAPLTTQSKLPFNR